MKKRLAALVCAVALGLSLLMPSASASGLFFLSVNDTLVSSSPQTTPIQSGGWVYVPINIFSSSVTGVNLGVHYGYTEGRTGVFLYDTAGRSVLFDLSTGKATVEGGGPLVPDQLIQKNGLLYVPAYAVCHLFGLTYSYYTTDYGPLLRIRNGSAILDDALFLNSAKSLMRSQYNSYYGKPEPVQPPAEPEPEPPVQEPDPVEDAPKFSMYLGLRAAAGGDLTAALDGMDRVNAAGVVFFPAGSLTEMTDQIRQAAGRGHRVGLIPAGDTPEDRLRSVEQGADLLAEILRQETWFVLGSDRILADAGYLCWSPGHTVGSGGTATGIYEGILSYGEDTPGGRILLDSRLSSAVLAGVLGQLAEDGDTFLRPRETRY